MNTKENKKPTFDEWKLLIEQITTATIDPNCSDVAGLLYMRMRSFLPKWTVESVKNMVDSALEDNLELYDKTIERNDQKTIDMTGTSSSRMHAAVPIYDLIDKLIEEKGNEDPIYLTANPKDFISIDRRVDYLDFVTLVNIIEVNPSIKAMRQELSKSLSTRFNTFRVFITLLYYHALDNKTDEYIRAMFLRLKALSLDIFNEDSSTRELGFQIAEIIKASKSYNKQMKAKVKQNGKNT